MSITIEIIQSILPGVVAALVGVLAGLMGSCALAKEERESLATKRLLDQQEAKRRAGHRAMLALESQRSLTQALYDKIRDESDFLKWDSLVVNRSSIPSVQIDELDFLVEGAANKNILPYLISHQQKIDQLIDALAHFAEFRREYETAMLTASPLEKMLKTELRSIAESLLAISKISLSEYPKVQEALQSGLKEVVPGFVPIFKI